MKMNPLLFINLIASAFVGVLLSQILIYVFTASIWFGFILLIIYVMLGVFAYRVAHVHTRRNRESRDHDKLARDGKMSKEEYMERYPNG